MTSDDESKNETKIGHTVSHDWLMTVDVDWLVFVVEHDAVVSMSIDADSLESRLLAVTATGDGIEPVLDAIRSEIRKQSPGGAVPRKRVLVLLSQPIRCHEFTIAVDEVESTTLTASLIGGLMGYDVELFNVDDAVAMSAWEDHGAALGPIDQLKWARRSRLSLFTTHHDHVGRSIVDSGKVIDGMHCDPGAWPWAWLTADRLSRDGDRGYFAWNLDRAGAKLKADEGSDEVYWATSVDELSTCQMDLKTCRKTDRRWLESAARGAVMLSLKESYGWKPWFLADSDARERESDELVEMSLNDGLDSILREDADDHMTAYTVAGEPDEDAGPDA